VDTLKIDRSFVSTWYPTRATDTGLVIINLAHALKLNVGGRRRDPGTIAQLD